jgi:regulator of sigma E protease
MSDIIIGVALVLGVIILIHEWGHFIVARLFKVRVDVFSIGLPDQCAASRRLRADGRAGPFGSGFRQAGPYGRFR